jgi:hypothetical protein
MAIAESDNRLCPFLRFVGIQDAFVFEIRVLKIRFVQPLGDMLHDNSLRTKNFIGKRLVPDLFLTCSRLVPEPISNQHVFKKKSSDGLSQKQQKSKHKNSPA